MSSEFQAAPPILLRTIKMLKVYSQDSISLGVTSRSIFYKQLQYNKITVSLQDTAFKNVTTVGPRNFPFFNLLHWGQKFDVSAWEFWVEEGLKTR